MTLDSVSVGERNNTHKRYIPVAVTISFWLESFSLEERPHICLKMPASSQQQRLKGLEGCTDDKAVSTGFLSYVIILTSWLLCSQGKWIAELKRPHRNVVNSKWSTRSISKRMEMTAKCPASSPWISPTGHCLHGSTLLRCGVEGASDEGVWFAPCVCACISHCLDFHSLKFCHGR